MTERTDVIEQAKRALAVPGKFMQTALAFPGQVDQALALVDNPRVAAELMARADMLTHYAKRVKADKQVMNAIGFGRLKIAAKIGELNPPRPPEDRGQGRNGPGGKSISPEQSDFHPCTLTKYRKVHIHLGRAEEYYRECNADEDDKRFLTTDGFIRFATGKEVAHVGANTGVPEWYTPAEYIEAARRVLGGIDLDPATSETAQKTVKASFYFTVDDDGLSHSWKGRVWLNPPYSADLVGKFVGKLCEHIRAGEVPAALLLVNNATETQWFQPAARQSSALCFPAGRIRFLDEQGDATGAPLQGQALLYFGDNLQGFCDVFAGFGFCAIVAPTQEVGNS
jgi:phage N-6-adenine-methyltransferase